MWATGNQHRILCKNSECFCPLSPLSGSAILQEFCCELMWVCFHPAFSFQQVRESRRCLWDSSAVSFAGLQWGTSRSPLGAQAGCCARKILPGSVVLRWLKSKPRSLSLRKNIMCVHLHVGMCVWVQMPMVAVLNSHGAGSIWCCEPSYVVAGNWTHHLCNSSKYSWLLNHLSRPLKSRSFHYSEATWS